MKKIWIFIVLTLALSLSAQEESGDLQVQGQYRNLFLGMSLEECKAALQEDSYFLYEDLDQPSLMQRDEETLLDCRGRSFIERAWFQFYQDRLVLITIQLNEEKLDYYSMYSNLEDKYGTPQNLSPQLAQWNNEEQNVQLELSRPLAVKYLDMAYINDQLESSRVQRAFEEELRDNFLEDF